MKKITLFTLTAFIILCTQSSCRKVIDYIRDHPDAHDSLCRVTKITAMGLYEVPDIEEVSYNAKGNPIMMGRTNEVFYFLNTDQHFRYDRFDRLTDYITTFATTSSVLLWHKYIYPNNSFIKVIDTLMAGSADANGPPPNASSAFLYTITGFTFDAHGRLKQRWSMPREAGQKPQLLFEFTYDANGNQPLYGSRLIYDNKVNVFRTNKVWQFIYEEYSRNNVMPASSFAPARYNEFGLPVAYPNIQMVGGAPVFTLSSYDSVLNIEYACTIPKGPINY